MAPTWTGADAPGTVDSFAYTGESLEQQAVWQSIYDWMKGEEKLSADAAPELTIDDGEVSRLSGMIRRLDGVAEEPERIGAGYALGRGAKAGSVGALQALVDAMRSRTERVNRAGMHGLATAGQSAVPTLLALIDESAAALEDIDGHGRLVVKQCIHALAESLEEPDVASVTAMVGVADAARDALIEYEAGHPSGEAQPEWLRSAGKDDRTMTKQKWNDLTAAQKQQYEEVAEQSQSNAAAELRQIVATTMASLGCVAERTVALGDVAACAVIADCLIECAGSEEVGSTVGGTPDAATAIPELARESATHGLIRLASNGAVETNTVHRSAVAGCDVSGNHRHYHFVAGFATEAALRCFEDSPTPVRTMLSAKLRAAAETSEFWSLVCSGAPSMFRGSAVEEVGTYWQEGVDPFGKKEREWDRKGLTVFEELPAK